MPKTALIFGILGQAGSYLAEFLVSQGYNVIGTTRKVTWGAKKPSRADSAFPSIVFGKECWLRHGVDFLCPEITRIIQEDPPDEIYNFASQLYAPASWDRPEEVLQVNGLAVAEILEAIRRFKPDAKFFQAGSAEMFGPSRLPCVEDAPRCPRNPYGIAKAMAFDTVRAYRERYGLFASTGIFFNMESGRRADFFFARKVVREAVRMRRERDAGFVPKPMVFNGGLGSWRDWGLAKEYVEAAWKMLQAHNPSDYVIATGESHSCETFVRRVLKAVGFDDAAERFSEYVCVGESKGDGMWSDPAKIWRELGWQATSKFPDVVRALVREEMERQGG